MFFIHGNNPGFSNGPRNPLRNCPDCTVLVNWVLNNYILADESLRISDPCLLVSSSLCRKLVSSLESQSYSRNVLQLAFVLLFVTYFNLSSCKSTLHLSCYIESFYTDSALNQKKFTIPWRLPVKNSK